MRTFKVPYSKDFISIQVPEANLKGVLESGSAEYKATAPEEALVEQALDNPIGSVKLEDLVKGKRTWSSSPVTIPDRYQVRLPCRFCCVESVR